jgi:pyochelin biosynthetic protein PchC
MTGWWWWPGKPGPEERAILFFPPAGADQTVARPLLAPARGLRLGVLRMPGRGPRQDEAAPTDLLALAASIGDSVLALGGPPPALVGHSFGGLLAYAVACRVEERGGRLGRLVALASASPVSWHRDRTQGSPSFVAGRVERILARGGLPAHIAADADLVRHARRLIATDITLMSKSFPLRPLACPVTVIRGRQDRMVDDAAVEGWTEVSAAVDFVAVPGDHFFYRSAPELLVTRLRMELSSLDGAYETP